VTSYDFIFSNKPHHRLYRHISFWLIFTLHFFIQNLIVGSANEALHPLSPLESLVNISYFLPIYFISTYLFIELVIPFFLFKRRYAFFFISTAVLLVFNFGACYFSGVLYEHIEWEMPYNQITFASNKYHAIVNGGFVSVMLLGIAGGIKLSKKWLQRQRENEVLAQQKIASELQLLKIQINPRFLFHSLHTLKQHILADSPRAPQLILQVADLLSYILYESDQNYVLLEKELGIVSDYLALEENSSDENFQIETSISGDITGKYFTPLILLSIVETSFEYFIEKQEGFSLKLFIEVADNLLDFRIAFNMLSYNSSEPYELNEKLTGIRKQLLNLYQGNHDFIIETTYGNTTILLKQIPLRNDKPIQEELITTSNVNYENV
jgi:two-component system, LytTR family, sensor kinase